ncbi:hypothetical protein GQF42_30260 [Streptomyces broussonetiae]|uniref:Uncharacterized protein n=1 Tax=Streptomyces broussonetiae TaxID=2686304 RepID=A0A6I6N6B6_9ACTN|nr:hypothetical protein GQF42_30260 [Streptomyces broussonetiae]
MRSLGIPDRPPVGPSSTDALSKYENSGAHGTDPPPGAHHVSSGWDASLRMWAKGTVASQDSGEHPLSTPPCPSPLLAHLRGPPVGAGATTALSPSGLSTAALSTPTRPCGSRTPPANTGAAAACGTG